MEEHQQKWVWKVLLTESESPISPRHLAVSAETAKGHRGEEPFGENICGLNVLGKR